MKKFNLLIVLLILVFSSYSQEWELTIDTSGMGQSGIETFDGNYAVTGTNFAGFHGGKTFLLDTLGNILHQVSSGGYCIKQTPDSGFVIAVEHQNSGGLMKLSQTLTVEWTKLYHTSTPGQNGFANIELTNDGGYIACGLAFANSVNTDYQIWLVRLDENADTLWTRSYGGPYLDFSEEVQQTSDGGFVIVGRYGTSTLGDPILYIIKTTSDGSVEWERTYSDYLFGESIMQTNEGGYIVSSDYGNILKLDDNGEIEWSINNSHKRFMSISQTTDYGFIAAGYVYFDSLDQDINRDVFIQKICPSGELSWSQTFTPGNYYDMAATVEQTSDGGYLMCGFNSTESSESMYIIKTNGEQFVCTDTCSAYFTLNPDTIPLHYVAVNMANGIEPLNYVWSWGDGTYDSIPYPTHIYDTSGTYTICLFITSVTGCSNSFCVEQSFKTDAAMGYVRVAAPGTSSIENLTAEPQFTLYPNPATNTLTINTDPIAVGLNLKNAQLQIHNAQGQLVQQLSIINYPLSIDVSHLNSGIYFLSLTNGTEVVSKKFVKE